MATQELKAKLLLEAETKGADGIKEIVSELEALAQEGGEAAPKFQELADNLREMDEQARAVDTFAELRREVANTAKSMDEAAANVDRLAAELAQAGQAAQEAAAAQAKANRDWAAARDEQLALKGAAAQVRAELRQQREALKAGGDGAAIYAEQIKDGAAQLKVLEQEQRRSAERVKVLATAKKEAAAESRAAAQAEKALADEYARSVQSAGQLSGVLGDQNRSLTQARQALDAAGISTQGLSDEQAKLVGSLKRAERQAQEYVAVVRDMHAEADSLGPALEATFKQLGMRGVAQITAEIERLQAAMRSLKGQKLLPEDSARASAELQRRIEALRGEMRGVEGDSRGASKAIDALGNASTSAGSKLGAAAHKALAWTGAMVGLNELRELGKKVLDTGSAFEQLERRLTGILGSADKARQAMAMLKQLAQDTPFDVQGLTDAYAKLSAFGLQPTREQMLAIADTAAKLGGGTEALTGVTLALGQAWTKGKLQGEEILQLAERGVPVWDLLAKATGKNVQELQKLSEAGLLGRDVILKLLDAMGSASAGASADLMASYAGAVQRAQDALQEFFNMVAQSGVLKYLTEQIQGLLAEFDRLKATGELQQWATKIGKGFIDIANAAQGVIGVLSAMAPVITLAAKAYAGMKLAEVAAGLTGVIVKGEGAAGALKQIASASIPAKVGLASVAVVAANLAVQVAGIIKNYGAYRAELAKHAALQASINQLEDQKAKKLKAISDATGVVVKTMQELDDAVAAGKLVFDQASASYMTAEQVQKKLSGALKETIGQMAAADASRIVGEFNKANAAAGETEKAIQKLAEQLQFKDVRGSSGFVLAMEELRSNGTLTAKQVGEAWQQALAKLSTGELGALRANLQEAARTGVITAKQLAEANDQILSSSFSRLGVNAAQALGKISEGAQEAINSVGLVADAAEAAGVKTTEAARAIEMAFMAAIPKADSLEAVAELEKQLKALGAAGKLSADGIKRTQEALDKQRATIEDQVPGIQSLGEALRQLGVKPQAELKALAASAKEAFDKVKESGTATPREINEAWKAMAEAAIKANDGVADSTIKSQAAAHGFAIKTDEAGKSIIESMKKAEDATRAVGAAAQSAAEQMDGMANVAWKAGGDLVAQARAHNAALGELKGTWIDATAAASRYSAEMAELVYNANKNVEEMRREHAQLVEQMEALARQQQQLQDQGNGAARGVEDLRLRLVELDGTEEEVARARMERDKANILRQRALLDLELKRAMLRQDDEEAARLREEIALYNEQLVLLDQVFAKEEKQRKAKASNAGGERSGGGSSGSSDSSSGGIGAGTGTGGSATYNITVNANGINDPVQLARQLVPELKKLDRLAR